MVNVISLTRVYNGATYLPRFLSQMKRLANEVLIVDDGSKDNTVEICQQYNVKVKSLPHTAHGGMLCNYLYKWAEEFDPMWVICCDVDDLFPEELESNVMDLFNKLCPNSYFMPYLYLWDNENNYRCDGIYANTHAIKIYKYIKGYYPNTRKEHANPLPMDQEVLLPYMPIGLPLLHFGYINEEERLKRFNYYSHRDNIENYNHIIDEKVELKNVKNFIDNYKKSL